MSRRDEAVDAIDSLVSTFRTQLATAIQHPDTRDFSQQQNRPRSSTAPSLVSRLSSFLDLPASTSSSTPSSPNLSQSSASVPFSSSRHTSIPLPPSSLPSTRPPSPSDDDGLPTYSRRPPIDPELVNSLPAKRIHLLSSRTGKLHLELKARGREHVILIQEEPDGVTELAGVLSMVLKEPESVTHVKIRLKGIVRTLVMKAHASGRHPISDEITFHESSSTLYDSSSFLPSNESPDPSKLLGSFSFPFSLSVPAQITHYTPSFLPAGTPTSIPLSRPIRPPPSFMLNSQPNDRASSKTSIISTQSPSTNGIGTGGFEVSCRYFLKVTLGRRGLLKLNERWIIPVVFVPRQVTPPISPLREVALSTGETRVPHSDQDPLGWTEEGKYKMKRSIKKPSTSSWSSLKGGKTSSVEIEIEGKTIRGQKIERGDAGTPGGTGLVPFEVTIKTNQVNVTGRVKPNMINVFLVQRTAITAQKLTNAQDVVVSRATSMHPFGPNPQGEPTNNGNGWKVDFGGNIKLPPHLGVSFRAPNLSVTYILCFSVNIGGISNDLSPLTIPIDLINCPPRRPISVTQAPASPPPPISPLPPPPNELHPPPPESTPANGYSNMKAPELPPRHPSQATAFSSPPRMNGSTGGGGGASSTSTNGRPVPPPPSSSTETRENEEAELEAVYGLPPSYFDTVGMDQQRR
ncbi:uncharacterized protein JCM6883_001263 [Sporobolomyces salmoneus]|uniref:uncharacterized protein n=1 Tax=Sporobolomyces salmoneus TaxID=183962 RepID=UPI00317AFB96